MGYFISSFLAYIRILMGSFTFQNVELKGKGPLLSAYMFLTSIFLLLWDQRLYPKTMRKLNRKIQVIIEYLISIFVLETLLVDFWFPLEEAVMATVPKVSESVANMIEEGEFADGDTVASSIHSIKDNANFGYAMSYALSSFFLLTALHATRTIDIRELTECGPRAFLKDITRRMKKSGKKIMKSLGFKRKVQIQNLDEMDFCPIHEDMCVMEY